MLFLLFTPIALIGTFFLITSLQDSDFWDRQLFEKKEEDE